MSITGWQLENYKQMETKQHTPEQPLVKKKRGDIKKYLKTNEDGNTKYQNLQDAAKAILIGKLIKIKRKKLQKAIYLYLK